MSDTFLLDALQRKFPEHKISVQGGRYYTTYYLRGVQLPASPETLQRWNKELGLDCAIWGFDVQGKAAYIMVASLEER